MWVKALEISFTLFTSRKFYLEFYVGFLCRSRNYVHVEIFICKNSDTKTSGRHDSAITISLTSRDLEPKCFSKSKLSDIPANFIKKHYVSYLWYLNIKCKKMDYSMCVNCQFHSIILCLQKYTKLVQWRPLGTFCGVTLSHLHPKWIIIS